MKPKSKVKKCEQLKKQRPIRVNKILSTSYPFNMLIACTQSSNRFQFMDISTVLDNTYINETISYYLSRTNSILYICYQSLKIMIIVVCILIVSIYAYKLFQVVCHRFRTKMKYLSGRQIRVYNSFTPNSWLKHFLIKVSKTANITNRYVKKINLFIHFIRCAEEHYFYKVLKDEQNDNPRSPS